MATVTIRPATEAAHSNISNSLRSTISRYHEFYVALFTAHPRDTLPCSIRRAFYQPDVHFLLAEDEETGQVMGFVRWKVVDEPPASVPVAEKKSSSSSDVAFFQPKKHLEEIWTRFCLKDEEMEACYEDAAAGERHFYVQHLMIHPAHQRNGIGGKLLSAVLQKATDEKLSTLLMSSAESFGLYTRLGFGDLGRWVVDNGYWMREVDAREEEMGLEILGVGGEMCMRGFGRWKMSW